MTLIRDVKDFYAVREWKRKWTQRVWKGLLSLDRSVPHLRCLFTPLFTHCHPQLIPHGDGAACPPQGPRTHPGPLWMPNWAYRSADWINSSVSGTFSPSSEEGDYSSPTWDPCMSHRRQREAERERGRGRKEGRERRGVSGWRKRKGQEGELLKLSRKRVPFCWQSEAGNVNWGQPKVSVFTGPTSSSRAAQSERKDTHSISRAQQQLSHNLTVFVLPLFHRSVCRGKVHWKFPWQNCILSYLILIQPLCNLSLFIMILHDFCDPWDDCFQVIKRVCNVSVYVWNSNSPQVRKKYRLSLSELRLWSHVTRKCNIVQGVEVWFSFFEIHPFTGPDQWSDNIMTSFTTGGAKVNTNHKFTLWYRV